MAERRIGIIRRASLKEVAEGWDECFITYRPASLGELAKTQDLKPDKMTDKEGVDFLVGFIKQHTVGGQVMTVADDGQLTSSALESDDIDYFPADVLNQLFADISGAKISPKDTKGPAPPSETPSEDAAEPTDQPSSTTPAT